MAPAVVCDGDVCRKVGAEEAAGAASSAPAATEGPKVFQLLGDCLLGPAGAQVSVSSITGPGKVIALYFSAHWCPPCRHFTPQLASIYTNFKKDHVRKDDWEVVFVSSDRDEESFKEYFGEMPWAALPYDKREAKAQLSKLYKVRGIPTLVILDGETGEVITTSGRDAVSSDDKCENFPWRPRTLEQIMEGAVLVEPTTGAEVPALERLRGKVSLLYFSASWCPPCRRFTPKLVEAMEKLRSAGKAVEVVFVSGDRDEESMKEYHSHMTWPALPFSDKKRNAELNSRFEVEGIPTLVVLDEEFKVITTDGTAAVASDAECARFPWRPQPLEQLNGGTASRINDGPVLVLVVDAADEKAAEAVANGALADVAAATKAAPDGDDWGFLWAHRDDDLAKRVLAFAGLVKDPEAELPAGHVAVIIDAPNHQAAWDLTSKGVEVSAAGLSGAVSDFKAGKLGAGKKLCGDDEDEE
ncbi:hypothetical protein HYH02_014996 [Chlamydomonas schloesseri]|uniref:Thioredoxin domain-containing protein n=1 Tax=Chlamydomonas schloesseri TaxID=2026947 RepID=A0A835VTU0_9CHLO|nr:hypothetical protein HYH02_014996 [Chlamydomonas schloesseri]|eukprot:KAG2425623.1 hypothetical protein HYH02_014996 [Chlamydomonas schloesseri]